MSMVNKVKIYIGRHGQDEDNANGILNGRRDTLLTELGLRQANDLAKAIKDSKLSFDAIYTSPLRRARETAEVVQKTLGLPGRPIVIGDLIERDFGVMTGKNVSEIEALCAPDIIKTEKIVYFLNPEGAETFPELLERGRKVVSAIESRASEGTVLIISHGDIGKMVYAFATQRSWEEVLRNFHFGNCDLIEVSPSEQAHVIKLDQHNH